MNEYVPEERYEIGKICITKEGNWWVQWYGEHAEQGGISFTDGNMGSDNLSELLEIVANNMTRCKDIYLEEITKKEGEKNDTDNANI